MKNSIIKADNKSLAVILFALLMYITGFVSINPISLGITESAGFPIVLQNMTAVCAGILLGGPQGAASVGLYITISLLLGFAGLPGFTLGILSDVQGLERLTGESGGFIMGYFFAAAVAGFMMGTPLAEKPSLKKLIKASAVAYTLIYVLGIAQFLSLKEFTLSLSNIKLIFTVLILPYVPFDLLKLTATILIGFFGRPLIARKFFLQPNNS